MEALTDYDIQNGSFLRLKSYKAEEILYRKVTEEWRRQTIKDKAWDSEKDVNTAAKLVFEFLRKNKRGDLQDNLSRGNTDRDEQEKLKQQLVESIKTAEAQGNQTLERSPTRARGHGSHHRPAGKGRGARQPDGRGEARSLIHGRPLLEGR